MAILKKILVGILIWESRLIVRKYKPFIVAVTGSVGKTSTKDAIYDVLKGRGGYVRKSEKSMNSEIGLPLTVIGVPNAWHSLSGWLDNISTGFNLIFKRHEYPNCLVLEIGADHPGDIKSVAKWLHPDIAVLTRVSRTPVHVEFFASPEEVLEEKAALATAVKPGGTLIVFGDDENTLAVGDRVKDKGVSVVSFGLSEKAQVRGTDCATVYENGAPLGLSFNLKIGAESSPVKVLGIIGETYMYPMIAAAAVGRASSASVSDIAQLLSSYEAPRGRMNVLQGINNSTLIDDSYNSSPDAVMAALSVLTKLEVSGNKIAVLGDMMELGKFAATEHRRIGKEVANHLRGGGTLIAVGQRSKLTAEEALKAGMSSEQVKTFDSSILAAEYLVSQVKSGDVILVKGSQSVRMERISAALLREPQKAAKLLVRQEKEWLNKP